MFVLWLKSRNCGGLVVGFCYVWGCSDFKVVFVMVFLIGVFGMNFLIFVLIMVLEFGVGVDGYGVFSLVFVIGLLIGVLFVVCCDWVWVCVVIFVVGGFGIVVFVLFVMLSYVFYVVIFIFMGFMIVMFFIMVNGYV